MAIFTILPSIDLILIIKKGVQIYDESPHEIKLDSILEYRVAEFSEDLKAIQDFFAEFLLI